MAVEKIVAPENPETGTPSLAIDDLIRSAEKVVKRFKKVGVRDSNPYWVPVKRIAHWELRQHYYEDGKRKTRVLERRKSKPRGVK